MLILSRKADESVIIADTITVKVVSIEKGVVKLGIDAPHNIRILRSELVKAVEHSNKEASTAASDESLLQQLVHKLKL
ncbi:carbon storage regulator [Sulfuricurvum sp. IAE1]|jgi:carbon storage regulator|uniref:carbon storage regulator CsrA n=1 Tax=Sulfuricurvum sp. IAE1 TaxID=2546102 RepID=UPI0010503C23|nr:carbon storage regulator CsrA [Sulfuricurvum sp. IAE1]MDX9967050.1 carbon storage regulator CsrA [Sulfuricurvum sp.]TDA62962.1 carbon storage regulator [Sulfuricurvum sp. IAE1]